MFYNLIADNRNKKSWASKARERRFLFFKSFIDALPKPITILDVGGTQHFWEAMNFTPSDGITIYLLNLDHIKITHPHFISIQGDATNMSQFKDQEFDVVFSNSVIEHLYSWENQQKMANEIRRVGKRYFVQTPNYWFPVEPHFVFPLFQFLPVHLRAWMVQRYRLGHFGYIRDKDKALSKVKEIRLLSMREMKQLFPGAKMYKDRFFGLTKSFVAYYFPE